MCSAYLYVLIALTEFQGESGVREEVGWVLVMIIVAIVGGQRGRARCTDIQEGESEVGEVEKGKIQGRKRAEDIR